MIKVKATREGLVGKTTASGGGLGAGLLFVATKLDLG
jgi:hypothetical protein